MLLGIASLTLIFPSFLFADSDTRFESAFTVVVQREDSEDSLGYATVIANFTATTLENRGIHTTLVSEQSDVDRAAELLAGEQLADLSAIPGMKQSEFALHVTYDLGDDEARFVLTCIDLKREKILATATETAKPILLMDAAIIKAVDTILNTIESFLTVAPETETEPETEPEPDLMSDLEGQVAIDELQRLAQVPAIAKRGFFFSPSFGVFQTLGKASEYFSAGIAPSLSVSYGFPTAVGRLAFGIYAGTIYFETKGEFSESRDFLSPFAVELNYTSVSNSIMDFVLLLSGGGAVLSVAVDDLPYVSKVIPYAGGGMGFLFFPLEKFSLGLDVTFAAYFDSPIPILGYLITFHIQLK